MVSLSQLVPLKANSIDNIVNRIKHHANIVLRTFNALYVLNPSLLTPAMTPKKPSNKVTVSTERNCSALVTVISKIKVHKNDMVAVDNRVTFIQSGVYRSFIITKLSFALLIYMEWCDRSDGFHQLFVKFQIYLLYCS